MSGSNRPLAGLRVVEVAAIGPVPFCGMLLADHGADVVRLDRLDGREIGIGNTPEFDVLGRGKRSIGVDLKQPAHVALAIELAATADVLLEGFRPGVMERLGLGPQACHARNPRLVYGRMTGWGQHGPLASSAGHDIDYLALTGTLHAIGAADAPPLPPLALVGDFAGGAMFLAFGVLAALAEARVTGHGRVVDAAIVDGVNLLMAPYHGLLASGRWQDRRGANVYDGAAPWYRTYATRDGRHVAVGAVEERFYRVLVERLGLDPASLPPRSERARWPVIAEAFAAVFATRARDEWVTHFAGAEACFAPVLGIGEAAEHPHARARGAFVAGARFAQPAPAPRFEGVDAPMPRPAPAPGEGGAGVLAEWRVASDIVAAFAAAGGLCNAAPAAYNRPEPSDPT